MTVKEKIFRGIQAVGLIVSCLGLIALVCCNYETELWLIHLLTFFLMFAGGLSLAMIIEIREQLLARLVCMLTVFFAMIYKLLKRPINFIRRCYALKVRDSSWGEMYAELVDRYNQAVYEEKYSSADGERDASNDGYYDTSYIVELTPEAKQSK